MAERARRRALQVRLVGQSSELMLVKTRQVLGLGLRLGLLRVTVRAGAALVQFDARDHSVFLDNVDHRICLPSASFWKSGSQWRITQEQNSLSPGVVKIWPGWLVKIPANTFFQSFLTELSTP